MLILYNFYIKWPRIIPSKVIGTSRPRIYILLILIIYNY